jgi:tetratricopeptide (TPR) repeat protein
MSAHAQDGTRRLEDRPRSHYLIAAAGLFIATILVYLPSFSGQFLTLDDYQYVVDNTHVRHPSWQAARQFFAEVKHPSTVAGYYQPLTMVSLMVDAWIGGDEGRDPWFYHATNIVLHAVNAVLVMWFMLMLLRNLASRPDARGFGFAAAIMVAAVFALHPVQAESVAWISQRKTVLASLFAFAALIAYLHFGRVGKRRYLVLTGICYLLGGLAKPTIMLLPVALILLDYWPLKRPVLRALPEKIPLLFLMLLMAYVAWESQASAAALGMPRLGLSYLPRWIGLLSYNLVLYLGNLVWPMYLSPYRALPEDLSFGNPEMLISVVIAMGFILSIVTAVRWSKPYFVGASSFVILLLPALGGVQFAASCVSDRFTYLPILFMLIPLGVLIQRLDLMLPGQAGRVRIILGMFAVPLVVLTWAQQDVWRDSRHFWFHVHSAVPMLAKANRHVASFYHDDGDYEKCREYAQRAADADPENAQYLHLLGRALTRTGAADRAIEVIGKALEIGLGSKESWGRVSLAEACLARGDADRAASELAKADESVRDSAQALVMMGDVAMLCARRCDWAIAYYRQALDARPDDLEVRHDLAEALLACQRDREALTEYEEIIERARQQGRRYPKVENEANAVRRSMEAGP